MTVVCGRARSGAGSVLRALICATFAVLSLVASGCGNNTFVFGTPVITVSNSAPGPFSSYLVGLIGVTLTRDDGTPVALVPNEVQEEQVEFTSLTDLSELFGAPAIPTGTYLSASISVDYTGAVIYVDVNGKSQPATIVSATGAAVTQVTYTVTFDPAHPLVVQQGVSTPVDLNFDLSASSVVNAAVSPVKVVVQPFLTLNTAPVQMKSIRSRGVFVAADTNAGIFTMNTQPFFDIQSQPFGAVTVQTTAQTTYNIDGTSYTGAAGLAAVSHLQVNTVVAAYGTLGSLSGITPAFNATQVYAGTSVESPLQDRASGVISARTGNTLTVHGATVFTRGGSVTYLPDLPLTVGDSTVVNIDGQPSAVGPDQQSISVGQQVDVGGNLIPDSAGKIASMDATAGQVRLSLTPVWGTLNAGATAADVSLDLLSLGGFAPAAFNFAGTSAAAGPATNPAAYRVSTGTLDESATAAATLLRMDGFVTAFGQAPPDFTAIAATPGTSTEQALVIDWISGGATAPFSSASTAGLVVNIANTHLGTAHAVQTGPASLDLTHPAVSPLIVADTTMTGHFAIGNATKGVFEFNTFAGFLTKIGSTLNGTNALQKLVALGHYDAATGTFTAYRIDLAQQ